MDKLITVVPPSKVTEEYKTTANTWDKWDSKKQKKFPAEYTAEERVLVLSGSATLAPDDGSDPVTIMAGDQVTFHVGFRCKWAITERMTKRYAIFENEDEDDDELPGFMCDLCKVDCFKESYFYFDNNGEMDLCAKCFRKDKKTKNPKYAGAQHQKEGIEVVAKPSKKQKTAN